MRLAKQRVAVRLLLLTQLLSNNLIPSDARPSAEKCAHTPAVNTALNKGTSRTFPCMHNPC